MKVGIITSGGDSPGMNWFIYALSNLFTKNKIAFVLFKNGYQGLKELNIINQKISDNLANFTNCGGTIIGSSRLPELEKQEVQKEIASELKRKGITHLVILGGNGSFKGAYALSKYGINTFTVPGTIDNDIELSEMSLGFYSALAANVQAINQIINCARSHQRFFIIQTMGGYASQLAIDTGLLTKANIILTHEQKWEFDEVVRKIKQTMQTQGFGLMVLPDLLIEDLNKFAKNLATKTNCQIRVEILGRIQRGATPNPYDSLLAIKLAKKVFELIANSEVNKMVVLKDGKIASLALENAAKPLKFKRALAELELFKEVKKW